MIIYYLRKVFVFISFAVLISFPYIAHAEDGVADSSSTFKKSKISVQLLSGALWSPVLFNIHRSEIDYYQTNLRIGLMLSGPAKPSYFIRGNKEIICEVTYADVFDGYGSYFTGGACLFRYNNIRRDSVMVPFFQAGAGIIYNDIHKEKDQSIIGQSIEFTLRGSVGARFLISKNYSIDLEGTFEHLSNAGLSTRNSGVNAAGAFIGFTYYFDKPWKTDPCN